MPKLVNLSDPTLRLLEYFPKAEYYAGKWTYNVFDEYPHILYVHNCSDNRQMLKNIRIHIERSGFDDIVYSDIEKSYQYCWNTYIETSYLRDWSNIYVKWWKFYLASEKDKTALLLKYGDKLYTELPRFDPLSSHHNDQNTRFN